MKLVIFSNPDNGVLEKIKENIFPKGRKNVFGYMPADGLNPMPEFTPFWQNLAKRNIAEFVYLDNSKQPTKEEHQKIMQVNTLMISGGNTFTLLKNLQNSGFFKIILELSRKVDFIYSGFSAGAIVATPTIRIAGDHGFNDFDENNTNLTDFIGLNFVDYEILPHYDKDKDEIALKNYINKYQATVRTLTDQEYLVL